MKRKLLSLVLVVMVTLAMLPAGAFAAEEEDSGMPPSEQTQDLEEGSPVQENVYEVSTTAELSNALEQIAAKADSEASIILKADVTAPAAESQYSTTFGVDGKHITVKSPEGECHALSFINQGILTGSCTFDNVNVTGYKLYCNGYHTIFTENGQIHLSGTLYGGGFKKTVASTYVVIAADGEINPSSSSGLHDVIGGSYQASVEGEIYLEITGNIKMQGGNHLNPGCVMGDGTSGDSNNSPDVYVGGNATLIYDNPSTDARPAIEGTYGCEMKGNVTLDIRAGIANGICGTQEFVDKSIIRGDLHIIAGAKKYENTEHTLRLNSNWPIVGAGNRFATYPGAEGNYTIDGNITIDTYENVWGWDKETTPPDDVPEIYGAIRGNVGGNITINAHGSHVEDITGASDSSSVTGNVTINATNVELKNSYYEDPDYDEGDILANYTSTISGTCVVNVDGGDINIIRLTNYKKINEGAKITISGTPKIRTGVLSTTNYRSTPENVTVTMTACNAVIPFIQSATQVYVKNDSDVTLNGLWLAGDLMVDEGSKLKTDEDVVELTGNAVINGTWEQLFAGDIESEYHTDVAGTMTVGTDGKYIAYGTTRVSGDVTSSGMMALMKPTLFDSAYNATDAELRLPVVQDGHNYNQGSIPLQISGLASGTTTVNTVKADDWNTLQIPALGDNYILTKKNADAPAQKVFLLGNEDALEKAYFLKRKTDAAGTDDHYMWQVATGIRVIFDKNGGDTEASPRIAVQDKVKGKANHFDLPATNPTRRAYLFNGWNTKNDGSGERFTAETDVTENMTVYAQWKEDEAYDVTIAPMDMTVYVGGNGYHGVIGEDGEFASNDLPQMGVYLILPDEMNELLGSTLDQPVDLSDTLKISYDDENGTTRDWKLQLYGDEGMSHVMEKGRRVFIYKLMPSKIDDTDETVPLRFQFTDAAGKVMTDSNFAVDENEQYRNCKVDFYPGNLDVKKLRASATVNGKTITRRIRLGSGSLRVRGNKDETYRDIVENKTPSVNQQDKDIFLVSTAQTGTQYFVNQTGISADPEGVKLLVDHSLDDALLKEYIQQTSNTENKYTYQFRYLDLVDTNNGNAYVTMGEGQKMDVYWPVPADAKSDSEFHIVHFKGLDRDADVDMRDLWTTHIPEEMTGTKVVIDGRAFVKFSTDSFSPFALLYEKDSAVPVPPAGGDLGASTTSVTVKKVWNLDDGGIAADSVTAVLLKDGAIDSTAVLNEANSWTHTWTNLNPLYTWTVEEQEVPTGFLSLVEKTGTTFTITNDDIPAEKTEPGEADKPGRPNPPTKPEQPADSNHPGTSKPTKPAGRPAAPISKLPQTGQNWLAVWGLAAAGMLMILVDLLRRKEQRKNENQ